MTVSLFTNNLTNISQNASQAFGPFSGADSANKFRLTNMFTAAANTKALAICSGYVLVQPQPDNSNAVNLILKPFSQPINGLNIKYFVYRGLLKSSFFTGANMNVAGASESDFINKINADFDAFYANLKNPNDKPAFDAKFIGFDTNLMDTTIPLYKFFFKDSDFVEAGSVFNDYDDFELPFIQMGKSLGNFITGIYIQNLYY
jgi:hypothetical protein